MNTSIKTPSGDRTRSFSSADELEGLFAPERVLGLWADEERAMLPGDYGAFSCCTNGARFVVDRVGGIVVGFSEGTNPTAHPEFLDGHDFAIVRGRYIVDLWAKAYPEVNKRVVLDLLNPGVLREDLPKYGDLSAWQVLRRAERPEISSRFVDPGKWRRFTLRDLAPEVRGWVLHTKCPRGHAGHER